MSKWMICLSVGSRRNQRCVVDADTLESAIKKARFYWKNMGEVVGDFCWGKVLPDSSVYSKSSISGSKS